jgi:membrane-bound metal-dependent hydrolase YbcI (DUF457 family)
MPSPAGHAIGAVAAGWLLVRPARTAGTLSYQAALLACIGMAPDLDLLIAQHRGESHSLGVAAVAASLAALVRWPVAASRWRIWLVVFAGWTTHLILDAMGSDTSAPLGVMAFWPFSTGYFISDWQVFAPISRQWRAPGFVPYTVTAVARELVILLPIALLIWWLRSRGVRPGSDGQTPAAP